MGRVYARVHAEQDEERKCKQFHGQHTANLSVSLSLSLFGGCSRSKRVKGRCCTTPPPPPLPWNALTQSKRPLTHVHRARVKHVAPRELPATIKSAVAYHLLWRQPFSPSPFLPSLSHGNRETERKAEAEAEAESEAETETERERERQRQRQREREREGRGLRDSVSWIGEFRSIIIRELEYVYTQ